MIKAFTRLGGTYQESGRVFIFLSSRDESCWLSNNGGLNYGFDQVLGTKPQGTILTGLDIGGGMGTFAARIKERNVTIVTTSNNLEGPFNIFIASRGMVSCMLVIPRGFLSSKHSEHCALGAYFEQLDPRHNSRVYTI